MTVAGLGDQAGTGLDVRDAERARREDQDRAGPRQDRGRDCAAASALELRRTAWEERADGFARRRGMAGGACGLFAWRGPGRVEAYDGRAGLAVPWARIRAVCAGLRVSWRGVWA